MLLQVRLDVPSGAVHGLLRLHILKLIFLRHITRFQRPVANPPLHSKKTRADTCSLASGPDLQATLSASKREQVVTFE